MDLLALFILSHLPASLPLCRDASYSASQSPSPLKKTSLCALETCASTFLYFLPASFCFPCNSICTPSPLPLNRSAIRQPCYRFLFIQLLHSPLSRLPDECPLSFLCANPHLSLSIKLSLCLLHTRLAHSVYFWNNSFLRTIHLSTCTILFPLIATSSQVNTNQRPIRLFCASTLPSQDILSTPLFLFCWSHPHLPFAPHPPAPY